MQLDIDTLLKLLAKRVRVGLAEAEQWEAEANRPYRHPL